MTKMMQDISLVTSVRQENIWIYLATWTAQIWSNTDTFCRHQGGRRPGLKVFPAPSGPIWRSWEQQRQTLSFDPSRARAAQTASNVGTTRKSAHKSTREDDTFSRSDCRYYPTSNAQAGRADQITWAAVKPFTYLDDLRVSLDRRRSVRRFGIPVRSPLDNVNI